MRLVLTIWLCTFPLTMSAVVRSNVDGTLPPVANTTTKAGVTTQIAPHVPGWRTNICVTLCPKWCQRSSGNTTVYTNCHYVCGNICHHQIRDANPFIGNQTFDVVPSSFQFSNYDMNKDKLLSIQEIARTDNVPTEDVLRLFQFADFNKDGFIDTDEFQGGPFVFTVQIAAEMSAVSKAPTSLQADSDDD